MVLIATRAAPVFEFIEPLPGLEFVEGSPVPVTLRVQLPDDVLSNAELFLNGERVGVVSYCCLGCLCPLPTPGGELFLRPRLLQNGGMGSSLTGLTPGRYQLTASGVSELGSVWHAGPLDFVVVAPSVDLILRMNEDANGVLRFGVPEGSLVEGKLEMWISHDLVDWQTLGTFEAANVAAFFTDRPDPKDPRPRFYRAVVLPLSAPTP